jgi:hypothetical protein
MSLETHVRFEFHLAPNARGHFGAAHLWRKRDSFTVTARPGEGTDRR